MHNLQIVTCTYVKSKPACVQAAAVFHDQCAMVHQLGARVACSAAAASISYTERAWRQDTLFSCASDTVHSVLSSHRFSITRLTSFQSAILAQADALLSGHRIPEGWTAHVAVHSALQVKDACDSAQAEHSEASASERQQARQQLICALWAPLLQAQLACVAGAPDTAEHAAAGHMRVCSLHPAIKQMRGDMQHLTTLTDLVIQAPTLDHDPVPDKSDKPDSFPTVKLPKGTLSFPGGLRAVTIGPDTDTDVDLILAKLQGCPQMMKIDFGLPRQSPCHRASCAYHGHSKMSMGQFAKRVKHMQSLQQLSYPRYLHANECEDVTSALKQIAKSCPKLEILEFGVIIKAQPEGVTVLRERLSEAFRAFCCMLSKPNVTSIMRMYSIWSRLASE